MWKDGGRNIRALEKDGGLGYPPGLREGRRGRRDGQVFGFSFLPPLSPQCDKLAADCAHELRRHGVSYVSLWPGLVQTEMVKEYVAKEEQPEDPLFKKVGKGRGGE